MRCAVIPPVAQLVPILDVGNTPQDAFVQTSSSAVAGVLSQLALVAYYSHSAFRSIIEETTATSKRITELQARYDHLQQGVAMAKKKLQSPNSLAVMKSLPRTRLELLDQERDELLSPNSIPSSLEYTCKRCAPSPNFDLLSAHKKGRPEMASYSNPNYFFECWAKEQQSSLQQRAKKKAGRRKRPQTTQVTEVRGLKRVLYDPDTGKPITAEADVHTRITGGGEEPEALALNQGDLLAVKDRALKEARPHAPSDLPPTIPRTSHIDASPAKPQRTPRDLPSSPQAATPTGCHAPPSDAPPSMPPSGPPLGQVDIVPGFPPAGPPPSMPPSMPPRGLPPTSLPSFKPPIGPPPSAPPDMPPSMPPAGPPPSMPPSGPPLSVPSMPPTGPPPSMLPSMRPTGFPPSVAPSDMPPSPLPSDLPPSVAPPSDPLSAPNVLPKSSKKKSSSNKSSGSKPSKGKSSSSKKGHSKSSSKPASKNHSISESAHPDAQPSTSLQPPPDLPPSLPPVGPSPPHGTPSLPPASMPPTLPPSGAPLEPPMPAVLPPSGPPTAPPATGGPPPPTGGPPPPLGGPPVLKGGPPPPMGGPPVLGIGSPQLRTASPKLAVDRPAPGRDDLLEQIKQGRVLNKVTEEQKIREKPKSRLEAALLAMRGSIGDSESDVSDDSWSQSWDDDGSS